MKKSLLLTAIFLSACQTAPQSQTADSPVVPQQILAQHFSGNIKGYDVVEYPFSVKKGQYLNISMATKFPTAYFNIMPPTGKEAIFNGSIRGGQFEGVAEETGEYKVQVYLMHAQARQNVAAPYKLEIIVGQKM